MPAVGVHKRSCVTFMKHTFVVDRVDVCGYRSTGMKAGVACSEKLYSVRFAKFRTPKFRKVVQQHTEGMMESIIWNLLEIVLVPDVKEF